MGDEIRAAIAAELAGPATDPNPEPSTVIDLPFIGAVDVGSGSLVLSTFLIALVDGVNPCSLWALSILLALVLRTGSRRRVLAIGGASSPSPRFSTGSTSPGYATLVFTPEAMSSVSGALAVFGIAIGAVLAIVGAEWASSRRRHTKNRRRSLGRVRG